MIGGVIEDALRTGAMQRPAVTIGPDRVAADAAQLMEEHNIRRLPVVDEDEILFGIGTDTDVLAVADIMAADVITIKPEATACPLSWQPKPAGIINCEYGIVNR